MRWALSLVLTAALAACHKPASNDAGAGAMFTDDHGLLTVPAGSPLRTHMAIEPVGGGEQAGAVELPAQIAADPARVANVVAPLTGKVVALKVGLGARVRRGQVLAILASGDAAGAYADAEKAADTADLAQKALDRAKGVKAAGGSADKDLEVAQSAFNQAQAELARTRTRLAALNGAGGSGRTHDLVLTAPQDGVVTTLALSLGQQITDPTAVLMTVANTDHVFVTANAPESAVGQFAAGADAAITLAGDPDHPLHGKISEADALLQPDTRRQRIRISLPNPGGRLLPNMYASVRLAARAAGGVFVPQSALLMNNDATTVLVEVRPWVFQRRAVKIGDETETTARVLTGLQPGERVVVKGGVLLDD